VRARSATQTAAARPGERLERWESRLHRKHHNLLDTGRGSTWWAPGAIAWWIGILFMIGATCFALGSVPGYATAVGARADNMTFFVGSLFFTSAAFLQFLESVNALPRAARERSETRFAVVRFLPRRIDWWATLVQLVGTLYFNVSTFAALDTSLTASAAQRYVWRPDALGSLCFLVASFLAWFEIVHSWVGWRPGMLSWWIALLNLGGSVAFGISAVAAKTIGNSGLPRNAELVNLGTFAGAIGFLVGAFLLLPERTQPLDTASST
jgi:hypothetical protein